MCIFSHLTQKTRGYHLVTAAMKLKDHSTRSGTKLKQGLRFSEPGFVLLEAMSEII